MFTILNFTNNQVDLKLTYIFVGLVEEGNPTDIDTDFATDIRMI
ncbi:hypothetical protein [Okeania sp. KiyG1]|nr:hypothetical protein [Okeania sp. KiyG1]